MKPSYFWAAGSLLALVAEFFCYKKYVYALDREHENKHVNATWDQATKVTTDVGS